MQRPSSLVEQDQLGILAFDDSNKWLQEPNFLTDPQAVQVLIGTFGPAAGPRYPPEAAYFSLVPSKQRSSTSSC